MSIFFLITTYLRTRRGYETMILGGLRGAGGGTDASVSNRGFCRIGQYSPFATTLDILEVYHHFQKKKEVQPVHR